MLKAESLIRSVLKLLTHSYYWRMLVLKTLTLLIAVGGLGQVLGVPAVKDFYSDRTLILNTEDDMFLGANEVLDANEVVANSLLMSAKHNELDRGFADSFYPPSQSFFNSKAQIEQSEVFSFLRSMPKGAALHTHDLSIASADWVISNLTYRENLYMCEDNEWPSFFWFNIPNPNSCNTGWKSVIQKRAEMGQVQFDAYLKTLLVINVPNPDQAYPDINTVWSETQKRFGTLVEMTNYEPIFRDYFRHALEEFLADNVQYIEIRTVLNDAVCSNLDTCDPLTQLEIANIYHEVADEFLNDHVGETCGASMIFAPVRRVDTDTVDGYLSLAQQLFTQHSGFFVAFDLVGQEDLGRPLIDFADQLINASNANPDFKFIFHAGETDWQGQTTDINIIDALLLGAKRIGHGYAIAKHPEAKRLAIQNDVPIEVCPISNQVLGLVDDLRNHPAATLIQEGFPVVISSDDPATWDASGLSYDYYEGFMALAGRNMDLRLIKKWVFSSVQYSAMDDGRKSLCSTLVQSKWDQFMQDVSTDLLRPDTAQDRDYPSIAIV